LIVIILLAVLLISVATIYCFIKSVDFRKFLAGAFFVSGGIQLYLAYAKVAVPVLGTAIVQTSEMGFARGVLHLVLCGVSFYFGFIKQSQPK
jgi:hypothetical protein